jgi:hypothetical protein
MATIYGIRFCGSFGTAENLTRLTPMVFPGTGASFFLLPYYPDIIQFFVFASIRHLMKSL